MKLSILIVNWNTCGYLEGCLRSIAENSPPFDWEVIVVDNASSDGSALMVAERFPGVRLIANPDNRGYAEGNNQALQSAKGECLLLLNPDIEVIGNALEAMAAFLGACPEAGAVACMLVHPGEVVQKSCRGFPIPASIAFEVTGLARLFPHNRFVSAYRMASFDYDRTAEVDQPMASAFMVRRACYEAVGPMDTQFPIFFNDVDWCYRIKAAGWKIFYTPDARMLHYGGQSTRQVRRAMIWQSHLGLCRFYRKHYRARLPLPLYALIVAAILASGVARVGLHWLYEMLSQSNRPSGPPPKPGGGNGCWGTFTLNSITP
ncbi:MAG: glycosyltransferase family 2 protein [Armatimonadetes bacterium]|nr:glycosyltransferase family 2 protein [Armatimonadota bacterium]